MATYAHQRTQRTIIAARHPPLQSCRVCPTHTKPTRRIAFALLHRQCPLSQHTLRLSIRHKALMGIQHRERCRRASLSQSDSPTRPPLRLHTIERHGCAQEPRHRELSPTVRTGTHPQHRLCTWEKHGAPRLGPTDHSDKTSPQHKRSGILHWSRSHHRMGLLATHHLCLIPQARRHTRWSCHKHPKDRWLSPNTTRTSSFCSSARNSV